MKGRFKKLIPGRRGRDRRKEDGTNTVEDHRINTQHNKESIINGKLNDGSQSKISPTNPEITLPHHDEVSGKVGDQPMPQANVDSISQHSPTKEQTHISTESSGSGRDKLQRSMSVETTTSLPCMVEDTPSVILAYDSVPILEQTKLPRGGVSMESQSVGRVQFGIPPETIKDSMRLGLTVPSVYIVPVERFCREMGPALGVNLAEFEFPAYFNYFVNKKKCTLVVDSEDAESNIRCVFSETLLGPEQFRKKVDPIAHDEEDFHPDFPREAIPNFQKELEYFRIGPDGKELVLETLLNFRHFETPGETGIHENLGIPPPLESFVLPGNQHSQSAKLDDNSDDHTETKRVEQKSTWTYSQARWIGDVSTVWPESASEEQMQSRTCKRVEIFKMPGGTEYILHDIDEKNHIVGKARFSGHVKVSESMSVDGFGGKSMLDEANDEPNEIDNDDDTQFLEKQDSLIGKTSLPPTFHPPSFGVTVLGNSHGFDSSGSVSGYVLWINGRGVMIDPPPYSSATLEREGIRPRTIVGIILTHCHADHDAGAFQKVLTGSPVVVITTPTIYKSFIQKYAALSALSPALLMHSHRHKPAIIGSPLRFQGATFRFTYTLHSIPCVGFRVEWRGRSMVFTADHFNDPPVIDKLQERGVLSKGRADDLKNIPLQETDLLLHEAGAPPIHTPLKVLLQLPDRVKRRLYVVHTSALPEDCDLRVAPTGTAGTIRLDQGQQPNSWSNASNEYETINEDSSSSTKQLRTMETSISYHGLQRNKIRANSFVGHKRIESSDHSPPLVSLRAASSTDAWFILNLLSAVPFLTSLSYASTMEVLETARVEAYCKDTVIVPSSRRNHVLCVVWEGTCVERKISESRSNRTSRTSSPLLPIHELDSQINFGAVWYAGDWTGPIALQPEKRLSGDSPLTSTHDVVAMSIEGVKVITVEFSNLHAILKSGSSLYRKYLDRRNQQKKITMELGSNMHSNSTAALLEDAKRNLNVLELLDCNSALRRLTAVMKRHLESLAEGPVSFQPGERLWRAGAPVDKAFVLVAGTASFVPKRRNAGSAGLPPKARTVIPMMKTNSNASADKNEAWSTSKSVSIGETMRLDAITAMRELRIPEAGPPPEESSDQQTRKPNNQIQLDYMFNRPNNSHNGISSSIIDGDEFEKLSRVLQKDADVHNKEIGIGLVEDAVTEEDANEPGQDENGPHSLENICFKLNAETSNDSVGCQNGNMSLARRRSSRARFANKVLGRLYSRRAFTGGLVFSRGHFLGDVSKMVAGRLSTESESDLLPDNEENNSQLRYNLCEKKDHLQTVSELMHEQEGENLVVHNSTLTAGKNGCVVLVFPKSTLCPFLDEYPGLLLSLLGTQVVV